MKTGWICIGLIGVAAVAWAGTPIDERVAADPKGLIIIRNPSGTIEVSGWDKKEVAITGTLGKGAKRLEVVNGKKRTTISVPIPKGKRVKPTHLDVKAPANSRMRIYGVSTDVRVSQILGDIDAHSVSGEVELSECAGSIDADSTSGDVSLLGCPGDIDTDTVSGDLVVQGALGEIKAESVSGDVTVNGDPRDLEIETVSGDIRIEGAQGKLNVETISGDVEVAGDIRRHFECEVTSGNIDYRGALGSDAELEVCSHSGGIRLELPAATEAEFDLRSMSGRIRNGLSGDVSHGDDRPWAKLEFDLGGGGASVEVRTYSGNIEMDTL